MLVNNIKSEILFQLRRIGLQFDWSSLKVLSPSLASSFQNDSLGRTLSIEIPKVPNSLSISDNIEQSILKNLRNELSFLENIRMVEDDECSRLLFQVNFDRFSRDLITDLKGPFVRMPLRDSDTDPPKTVIFEYSSPNIAKPFHVGHFRSTILGNSIANIFQFKGDNVIRLNYLGDWGTQYGILSLAYDQFGDEAKLRENPLKHLFEVYVQGNREMEQSDTFKVRARERFAEIESRSNPVALEQWARFRELSIDKLKQLYERLGIEFDAFTSESMYCNASYEIIKKLQTNGVIETTPDGASYAICNSNIGGHFQTIKVPVLKNDGTTLYLTRDIAAALHRQQHYHFDRMFYVVDSSQSKHFNNLKSILNCVDSSISSRIRHLKYGRIIGMSTRKGQIIFLDDLLDEAKQRALEAIQTNQNTKISPSEYDSVADVLGVSAVVAQDLSHKRVSEYKFNWSKALKMSGDTGVSLQYTHARLCSLQVNCGVELDLNADIYPTAINTEEGRSLLNHLAMFEQAVDESYQQLEPNVLMNYLFSLKNAINRANQKMTIKGESMEVAKTRAILFHCSRNVLSRGMRLIGLEPLRAM